MQEIKKLSRNNIKSRVDLDFRYVWNTKQILANDLHVPRLWLSRVHSSGANQVNKSLS